MVHILVCCDGGNAGSPQLGLFAEITVVVFLKLQSCWSWIATNYLCRNHGYNSKSRTDGYV